MPEKFSKKNLAAGYPGKAITVCFDSLNKEKLYRSQGWERGWNPNPAQVPLRTQGGTNSERIGDSYVATSPNTCLYTLKRKT